jgi:hypothetical protein
MVVAIVPQWLLQVIVVEVSRVLLRSRVLETVCRQFFIIKAIVSKPRQASCPIEFIQELPLLQLVRSSLQVLIRDGGVLQQRLLELCVIGVVRSFRHLRHRHFFSCLMTWFCKKKSG